MLSQAEEKNWKLCVLQEVLTEISKERKVSGGPYIALKRIEVMQKVLGSRLHILPRHAGSLRTYDVLLKSVVENPKAFLLTDDRVLAIRVRNEFIKRENSPADCERVLLLSDFVPMSLHLFG